LQWTLISMRQPEDKRRSCMRSVRLHGQEFSF
jgi:hypothetical protein